MAINKYMRAALKTLSYTEPSMLESYEMMRRLNALKSYGRSIKTCCQWDHLVPCGDHDVPVRIFSPDPGPLGRPVLLFFHGGGWVTGNIDDYNGLCASLAKATGQIVASVDYRLAPEYKFPAGLNDCYAVAQSLFKTPNILRVKAEQITLVGDSAGGNLAAAVSLMARDRGEFLPRRQILIYPATQADHSEQSPFNSVRENGKDYLLTAKRVAEYMQLYMAAPEDLKNPYLAPLLAKDLSRQPDTLIITAEFDPLRDEGEAYAAALKKAGNFVALRRIPDALHGFMMLPPRFKHVRLCMNAINDFISEKGAAAL